MKNFFFYSIFSIFAFVSGFSGRLEAQTCNSIATSDNPCNAPLLCSTVQLDTFCGRLGAPGLNLSPNGLCTGITIENNQWIRFVVDTTELAIQLNISNCTIGTGSIQAQLFKATNCGDASTYTSVSNCFNVTGTPSGVLLAQNLTVGDTLYLMLDGNGGAICSYTLDVLRGRLRTTGTAAAPISMGGLSSVCPNAQSIVYTVPRSPNALHYNWNVTYSAGGTPMNVATTDTFLLVNFPASGTANVCASYVTACNVSTPFCKTVTISNAITGVNPTITLCSNTLPVNYGNVASAQGVLTFSYGAGTPATETLSYVWTTVTGCDSTVTVTVQRFPVSTSSPIVISRSSGPNIAANFCGTSVTLASGQASRTGIRTCVGGARSGCDSTINYTMLNGDVLYDLAPLLPVVTCSTSVTLVITSSPFHNVTTHFFSYKWIGTTSTPITNATFGSNATQVVNAAGVYRVVVKDSVVRTALPRTTFRIFFDTLTFTVGSTGGIPAAPQPVVNNPTQICLGTLMNIRFGAVNDATSYVWTYPALWTTTGATTNPTIQLTAGGATGTYPVSIAARNACGTGPATTINIRVDSFPRSLGNLSGNFSPCQGGTEVYTVDTVPFITNYVWSIFPGTNPAQIVAGQGTNTIRVNWNGSTGGRIDVYGQYVCGNTEYSSRLVLITSFPNLNAGVDSAVCGRSTTLNATTSTGTGNWSVVSQPTGGGAVFINGTTRNAGLTVLTAGTYRLAWSETQGGCTKSDSVDIVFKDVPTVNAGVDASICGTTTTLAATSSNTGTWTLGSAPVSGAAAFTNNVSTTSNVTVTTAGTYRLAWTSTLNGCAATDTVDVVFRAIPTVNAGVDAAICGTTATLSATNSAGSTGAWTVATTPAGGTATFTNATAANSGVNITTTGIYKLAWTATANGCPKSDTVDITFKDIPTANAGVDAAICGTTATLSATNSAGSTGAWTVATTPAGGTATFTNATAANSVVNITTAGIYKLAWTATANGCPKADTVDITFNPIPTVNAGVDTTGCGRNMNLNANNNIGTGLWSVATQPTGGGAIFANSTTRNSGLTVLVAGTYRLVWTATAAGCPKSDTVDVLFNNFPTINAGVDSAICGRATSLNGSSNGTGAWSIVTAPGGGTAIFSNQSAVNSGINVTLGGTYSLAWTGTLTGCSKSDTVNLRFNDIPAVSNVRDNCNARNDSVVVQFNITGGTQPYTVFVGNTNTIAGTVTAGGLFVSNRRDTGVYQYTVRDANSCTPSQISGRQACRTCFTVAGDMNITPIKVCQGDSARGIYLGGYTRDTSNNDTIQYVLHRGDVRTQTLFRSRTPIFGFRAPMAYDSTYFISAVAGNDSLGNVAFSDPCLSISQSVPVSFHRNPTIVFGADTTVCGNGGCANLRFLMTGKPNFNVTINNGVSDTTLLNQPLGATLSVCPAANTTYRLVSIRDSNNCSNSVLPDIMNITVRRAAFAGRDTLPLNVCFGVDTIISLPIQINGEDAGGRWTEYSSPTSTGGRFSAAAATFRTLGQAVNTYKFRYVVTGTAPCPNDTSDVVVNLLAKPVADAGIDDTLNCTNISTGVQIGGINTTTGNVAYSWQGTVSNSPRPIANNPGIYILTVTGQFCSASDSVRISIDTVSPIARIVADRNIVNCRFDTARLGGSTSTPIGRLNYDWALGANIFDNNPLTSVTQGGLYALIVTNTQNGCIDADTVTINADRVKPLVRIARPPVLNCRDSAIIIDGSASSSGLGRYTYTWSTTNGIFVSRRDTLTPRVRQEGDYRLVIRDTVNFCSDSANTTVRRDTVKPRAFARAQDTLTCLNQTVNLTGSGSSIGLGISYLWTTRDGQIVSGAQSLVPIVDESGRYLLTVSNANNGCFDTASITVVRNTSRPNGLNLTVQQPKCYGGCDGTIRVDSVKGGTSPYIFSIDGKVYTAARNLRNICAGSYRFYVQDASGCNWDTTFSIRQNTQLAVSLGGDTTIVLGDSLRIRVLTPDTALIRRITWTPIVDSAARRSTRAFSQIARPLVQTQFKVTIVDSLGCSATTTMTVFINKDRPLFTPNIFSPNGDGYNDKWVISASQVVKSIKRLEIFDRWGNRVFAAQSFKPDDPNFGWDGNFEGKPLNPAVFTFWFEVEYQDGQTEIIEGDLTLMR